MRRIVKPPGGECSDIFGDMTSPVQEQITPRKSNNYMQSTIFSPHSNGHSPGPTVPGKMVDTQNRLFGCSPDDNTPRRMVNRQRSSIFEDEGTTPSPKSTPDSVDSPHSNGHSPGPTVPGKMVDTQDRLFGCSPDDNTPRRMVNRQRSSIFEDEGSTSRVKSTPGRRNVMNPITGEQVSQNGISNGSTNGTPNGIAHGTNGYMNGHSSPDSPMNGNSFRVRNPPGGKSSGIF